MRVRPLIATAAAVLATVGCADTGTPSAARSSGASSAGPPTAGAADRYLGMVVEKVPPARVERLSLPVTGFLAASTGPDRLWVGASDGLAWVDPATREAHLVDHLPGIGLTVAGDRLYRAAWAGNTVAVYDISAGRARELARAPAPSPLYIAAGPAGVWAADHDHGRLLRLDPDTVRITATVTIGSGVGLGTAGMAWIGDRLWVVSKRDDSLYEVDGHTGRPVARVDLGGFPGDEVTLTAAGIWVEVDREDDNRPVPCLVDPGLRRVVTCVTVRDPANVTEATAWMVAAPVLVRGQVWVPVDRYLVHLDPGRGWRPDRVLELPTPLTARFALSEFGSVWIHSPQPEPAFVVRVDDEVLS